MARPGCREQTHPCQDHNAQTASGMDQMGSNLPLCVFELDILPCTIATSRMGDAEEPWSLELEARVSRRISVSCNFLYSTPAR